LQNEEPQRPATARPSLLSPGPTQGETLNILSELDGKTGHAAQSGKGARPGRKGLVAGTVLALVAMGGTAALVLHDVGTVSQLASVSQGLARGAAEPGPADGVPAQDAAPSGGDQVATAGAPSVTGPEVDKPERAGAEPAATNAAMVAAPAAPAAALAAALAASPADKPSTAATIIDTPQAVGEPAPVRKAVAKVRKSAPARERRTRLAKAKSAEQKVAKVKTHKKPAPPAQKNQAAPDSDVELLAALVAHTKPQPATRAAPCPPADDKAAGAGAACGAGHKQ